MIKTLIDDIKVLIEDIYKSVYESYKEDLENEDLADFVNSIRYYEIIIQELEQKEFYENKDNVELSLNSIKKNLASILEELNA